MTLLKIILLFSLPLMAFGQSPLPQAVRSMSARCSFAP